MIHRRIWARLHLRSVRIGLERHVLLIIEDLTHDKKQLILTQRHDEKYRKANFKLGKRVDELTEKVRMLRERLETETVQHTRTRQDLCEQEQAFGDLWDRMPAGLAMIGSNGAVKRINHKFSAMFGYDVTDLVDNKEWIAGWHGSDDKPVLDSESAWIDSFVLEDYNGASKTIKVIRKDGSANEANLTAVKTPNKELLLIFDVTEP